MKSKGEATSCGGCRRRRWLIVLALLALCVVAAELSARWFFGMGSGEHMIFDDEIEYMCAPSEEYHWIGHTERYNEYSMRSDSFPARKTNPNEIRVMVLADSVTNGGSGVSQEELATELLKHRLSQALGKPVVVGNISAGSWGPPNLLAYVKRFGLFDADVVLIVTNEQDAWDVPKPLSERPKAPPAPAMFALQDLAEKLLRRLQHTERPEDEVQTPERAAEVDSALHELVRLARQAGARVAIVQHIDRAEFNNGPKAGTLLIKSEMADADVEFQSTEDAYHRAADGHADRIYRDTIHLNAQGHQALAGVLFDVATELLKHDDDGTSKP